MRPITITYFLVSGMLLGCSQDNPTAAPPVESEKIAIPPYLTEGTFVASGWMGDAGNPSNQPLNLDITADGAFSAPTSERWTYLPAEGKEEVGSIAVAYQGPTANNWGNEKGVDLSGKGYTRLTFMARGEKGGEKLLVSSGGQTGLDAKHPASYEATIAPVVLESTWKQYEIPLENCDLSNTCSVFTFAIDREMAPEGCTFYLDDIAMRGPQPE